MTPWHRQPQLARAMFIQKKHGARRGLRFALQGRPRRAPAKRVFSSQHGQDGTQGSHDAQSTKRERQGDSSLHHASTRIPRACHELRHARWGPGDRPLTEGSCEKQFERRGSSSFTTLCTIMKAPSGKYKQQCAGTSWSPGLPFSLSSAALRVVAQV